jgi:hypothetical protein
MLSVHMVSANIQSDFTLGVIMLSAYIQNEVKLCVSMMNIIMLSANIQNDIRLCHYAEYCDAECQHSE